MADSGVFRTVRMVSLIALAVSVFFTTDLLINYLWATIPSLNDGIGCHTFFPYFGDDGWSLERYFFAFRTSAWITTVLAVENIILTILAICKR